MTDQCGNKAQSLLPLFRLALEGHLNKVVRHSVEVAMKLPLFLCSVMLLPFQFTGINPKSTP